MWQKRLDTIYLWWRAFFADCVLEEDILSARADFAVLSLVKNTAIDGIDCDPLASQNLCRPGSQTGVDMTGRKRFTKDTAISETGRALTNR